MDGKPVLSAVIPHLDEQVWEHFFPLLVEDRLQDIEDDDIEAMIARGEE